MGPWMGRSRSRLGNEMGRSRSRLGDETRHSPSGSNIAPQAEPQAEPQSSPSSKSIADDDRSISTSDALMHRDSIIERYKLSCLTDLRDEELWHVFKTNENERQMQREHSNRARKRLGRECGSFWVLRHALLNLDARNVEMAFDSVIGLVILANAICLGVNMDIPNDDTGTLLALDIVFAVVFIFELVVKLYVHGFRHQYCGKDALSNIFDSFIILGDASQIFLYLVRKEIPFPKSGQYASVLRVARLLRLTRILRVLRFAVFQDLLAMIQGMLGGMATLGWAIVLFILFVYVLSLIFRESLGTDEDVSEDAAAWYFQSVPRSMFTIFRCSFGDCSTKGGTPIFEHVSESHGSFWSFTYSLFMFIVVIGLFNVISAIFVENTMAFAIRISAKK